jgi:hypothetical protein
MRAGRLERQQFRAFGDGALNFFGESGHVCLAAAVNAVYLFGASRTAVRVTVHCDIAPADDRQTVLPVKTG